MAEYDRVCRACGSAYVATRRDGTACSPECWTVLNRTRSLAHYHRQPKTPKVRACKGCGIALSKVGTRAYPTWCPACKTLNQQTINRRKSVTRRGARSGTFTVAHVGNRDGWKCHLCGLKVNRNLSGMAPKGPTIDHLIPLSCCGLDTLENVRLAHRLCNVRRSTGGIVQLLLVG